MKFFKGTAARAVFGECRLNRFAFDVEVLVLAQAKGMKIVQLPVVWTNSAQSKVHAITDSLRMLYELVQLKKRLGKYD